MNDMKTPPQPALTSRGTVLVDLTLELSNGMPGHEVLPKPIILPWITHEQSLAQGLGAPDDPHTYHMIYLSMLDHTGTHVDAPSHYGPNGATIDEVPLDWFTGPAVCLDLRHIPDRGDITTEELQRAEEKCGVKIDGHIVLLCTGFHARHWPNPSVGSMNPGLTAEATHWLADRSRVHGVEGGSTDKAPWKGFPSHRVCRDRGILHYEWLVNLEQLVDRGEFTFTGYPLRVLRGSGSPVRAVAEYRP